MRLRRPLIFFMTERFVKERFGWVCRRCRDAAPAAEAGGAAPADGLARFCHEGEAEERVPRLSAPALARRRESGGRAVLYCPRCGAEEEVKPSAK